MYKPDFINISWVTCSDSSVYSLDLSLSLHEDKFPLPGESPLQPGEVLLEEPIRRGVIGIQGL